MKCIAFGDLLALSRLSVEWTFPLRAITSGNVVQEWVESNKRCVHNQQDMLLELQ